MKKYTQHLAAITLLTWLSACQSTATQTADLNQVQTCPEPRPQICTMIYDPVCARHKNGSLSTKASNCSACADITVVEYQFGACPEPNAPTS